MRRVALVFAAGFLAGTVASLMAPAAAHHQPEFRRLKAQVQALSDRVAELESAVAEATSDIGRLERAVTTVTNDTAALKVRMSAAESAIRILQSKTVKLDSLGNYTGRIDGWQVMAPVGFGCFGQPAVWDDYGQGLFC